MHRRHERCDCPESTSITRAPRSQNQEMTLQAQARIECKKQIRKRNPGVDEPFNTVLPVRLEQRYGGRRTLRDAVSRVSASLAHLLLSSFEPLCMVKPPAKSNVYCCDILKVEESLRRTVAQLCVVKVIWIPC